MDDFPGDATTTGQYRINGAPLLISSDFDPDHDWIRVEGLKRYYDYEILTYAPDGDLEPVSFVSTSTLYSLGSEQVASLGTRFRRPTPYRHSASSGAYFLDLVSRPTSGGAEPSYYRFFMRQKQDVVGNTNSVSTAIQGRERSGALELAGDVDVYSFEFRAGVTYTINLLGTDSFASRETTLGDPILRIFDENGAFIKGDNNSGAGKNSELIFSPSSDSKHFLHVIGGAGATGSYVLKSEQFDDYLASTKTEGVLIPNGTTFFGRSDFTNDVDWIRVKLFKGFSYEFESNEATISPADPDGNFIPADSQTGLGMFTLSPNETGDYFVVASQFDNVFHLTARIFDDYGVVSNTGSYGASPVVGAIETPSDRDRFRVNLLPYATYRFEVKGIGETPVEQPGLVLRDQNLNLVHLAGEEPFTYRAFPERSTDLSKQPYAFDVRSDSPTAFGTYEVSITSIDKAAGDTSTLWNVDIVDGAGIFRDAIETVGDVDYHRVKFQANTWYELEARFPTHERTFQIVDPDGIAYEIKTPQNARFYYAAKAGDYYFIHDSKDFVTGGVGGYSVRMTEGSQPTTYNGEFNAAREPLISIDGVTQYNIFDNGVYPNVELYSDIPLAYQSDGSLIAIPARQLTTVSIEQWETINASNPEFTGQGEIFSRGIRRTGVMSSWSNIQVNGWGAYPDFLTGGPIFDGQGATYAFAEGLPSYLVGDPRFPDFGALRVSERETVETAMASWNSVYSSFGFTKIEPGVGNDAADTMVFRAALPTDDLLVFVPGPDEGGDIILNTNAPFFFNLERGKQGYFEIVRAIGILHGLKETTEVGRDQSVMGARFGADFDSLPFPNTPLPMDIRAVRQRTDNRIHKSAAPKTYSLQGADHFYAGIADSDFFHTDDQIVGRTTLPTYIDLRPGMSSYSVAPDGSIPYTYVNSFFTMISGGQGGEANDGLIGNHLNNTLEGHAGNDMLRGGSGSDSLFGGSGNDYYIFRPGYGHDRIDELEMGGVDVLRLEGMHNMDSLADDITFERLDNDLIIRLEMDGSGDLNGDSIRVVDMGTSSSRVEAMTLLNPGGAVVRLSLVSVFDQITSRRQRFQIAAGSDDFGQLVSPV